MHISEIPENNIPLEKPGSSSSNSIPDLYKVDNGKNIDVDSRPESADTHGGNDQNKLLQSFYSLSGGNKSVEVNGFSGPVIDNGSEAVATLSRLRPQDSYSRRIPSDTPPAAYKSPLTDTRYDPQNRVEDVRSAVESHEPAQYRFKPIRPNTGFMGRAIKSFRAFRQDEVAQQKEKERTNLKYEALTEVSGAKTVIKRTVASVEKDYYTYQRDFNEARRMFKNLAGQIKSGELNNDEIVPKLNDFRQYVEGTIETNLPARFSEEVTRARITLEKHINIIEQAKEKMDTVAEIRTSPTFNRSHSKVYRESRMSQYRLEDLNSYDRDFENISERFMRLHNHIVEMIDEQKRPPSYEATPRSGEQSLPLSDPPLPPSYEQSLPPAYER